MSNVSEKSLLRSELLVLERIVEGNYRSRIYRHHVFFTSAKRVLRVTQSFLSKPRQTVQRSLQIIVRCGEDAANELRANRVDTVPLSLAIIGVCARLHMLLSRSLGSEGLPEAESSTMEPLSFEPPSKKLTIGSLVDLLVSREPTTRKRKRDNGM